MNRYLDANGVRILWEKTVDRFADRRESDARYGRVLALLRSVRDALENGDTQEAISLLDTFLLDQGVLE